MSQFLPLEGDFYLSKVLPTHISSYYTLTHAMLETWELRELSIEAKDETWTLRTITIEK